MSFGLTAQGFVVKPIDQILSDMEAVQLAQISTALNLQPTALLGVLNGVQAGAISELWQLAAALYAGMDPSAATDAQLDSLALITGTKRLGATPTVCLACTVVTDGTFAGAAIGGMIAALENDPSIQFSNLEAIPSGAGTYTIDFQCLTTGPISANSGTLTILSVPLTGWLSITNPTDGVIGRALEGDVDLRIRRNQELQAAGSGTALALRSDVLEQLPKTLSCTVLHNDGDVVDGNGLTPHSIEVIAYLPGATSDDDQALVDLIGNQKPAGINTNGTSFGTFTDSNGNTQTIYFTRPSVVDIYVTLTVLTDPATRSPDPASDITTVLVDYGQTAFAPGLTVYGFHLVSQIFAPDVISGAAPIPGLLNITAFNVGTAPSPVTTDVTIGPREVANLQSANIAVTITP